MSTNHTPGPWTTDGDRIDSMDHWVAEAVAPSLGVRRADARLIAAAPSYAKAWAMVPEEIRERILSAIDSCDAETIDRAEGKP